VLKAGQGFRPSVLAVAGTDFATFHLSKEMNMTTSRRTLVTSAIAAAATLGIAACASSPSGSQTQPTPQEPMTSPATTGSESTQATSTSDLTALETTDAYTRYEYRIASPNGSLYGELYVPASSDTRTMVIMSHSFSGTHSEMAPLAERLAQVGMAGYVYDFVGGSTSSASGNDTTRMSVLTEKADLNAVFNAIQTLDVVDASNIFLLGASQGGYVSALEAADLEDRIAGLILYFPALVIPDDARSRFASAADIPEKYSLFGTPVGRIYFADVYGMDPYSLISGYTGPVIIFHGDQDNIVPISYSQNAVNTSYSNAQLVTVQGAGHSFSGDDATSVAGQTISFIEAHQR
jgi:hypothetical protein